MGAKLKVLTYTSLFPNSVQPLWGRFVMERLRYVAAFADVSVVAPVPYFPRIKFPHRWSQFALVPRSEEMGQFQVAHPRFPLLPRVGMATHGLCMFAGSLRLVLRHCRDRRPDLIDAHYVYPDGLAAVLLGSILKIPVVVSARGTDVNLFPEFRTIKPWIRHTLGRATSLIALSEALKSRMVELGCPAERITVIRNGVDCTKFYPCPKREARQRLGLPPEGLLILSVGHLKKAKGFGVLVEALRRLKDHGLEVSLAIVGEGAYRGTLDRLIQEYGLAGRVHLAGATAHEELPYWYNAADLFCLASFSEGCPNVLLEAMACGLPVVATRVGGIPEIVTSQDLGLLTDGRVDAVAAAIATALQHQWNSSYIANCALQNNWEAVAEKVSGVFRRAVTSYGCP